MTIKRFSLKTRAQRLIWGVAALGIGCSLLNLCIIALVLQDVSRAGARSSRISLASAEVVAAIEMYRRRSGYWIDSALTDRSPVQSPPPDHGNLEEHIELALRPMATSPELRDQAGALQKEFRGSLATMASLFEGVGVWSRSRAATDIELAKAGERTETAHAALRSAASARLGSLRLERLVKTRRYREATGAEAEALARDLIFDTGPVAALVPVDAELSELALLIERLRAIATIEELESLRANQFAPAFQRLSDAIVRYADLTGDPTSLPRSLVTDLQAAVLGPTSQADDLFTLTGRSIALDHDQRDLRRRYEDSLEAFTRCQQHLTHFVQASMAGAAHAAAESVRFAQGLSAAALIVSAAALLFLGRSVARNVSRQASELESTNRSLDEAIASADAANRAKSEFLANMSHEIRTPMTAILGYAELLLDPRHSPSDRVNHLQTIRRNADHLLAILNDILDLSKIEAGALAVEKVPMCPAQLIHEVFSLLNVRAAAKGVDLRVVYDSPLPATILSDPLRLRQILFNLVGNALKFTDHGSVTIYAALTNTNPRAMTFSVADTGIGMSDEQVAQLFKPFSQADTSATRRFGGTGLGLAISKRLAAMLGGDITVQCTLGRGCTFTLSVDPGPLEGVEMIPPSRLNIQRVPVVASLPQEPVLRARILLAEDGIDNQRLLSHILRGAGAEVDIVENGRAAVDAAQAGAYDVVLLDMQMPVLDGYSAASLLRQRGYTRPIVALTAHAMADDRAKCLAAGCDDYLTKPIDRRRLLEAIQRFVSSSGDGAPAQSAA